MFIQLLILIRVIHSFLYEFDATSQYLLIENESIEWTFMEIKVYEFDIKQSETSDKYEIYIELYYKLRVGQHYVLDVVLSPNSSYSITQVNQKDCAQQCSNNGICKDIQCTCSDGYIGQEYYTTLRSRCQYAIDMQSNISQYNVQLNRYQTTYLMLQYKQQDLLNDQGQTKNLNLKTNQLLDLELYIVLPFQSVQTSISENQQLFNQSLVDSTSIDYSNYYQSYSVGTINYAFFFIISNQNMSKTNFTLSINLANSEITFQDFILVTILSVVAFIILLIVIFIVRKRCQYISISKLRYQIDAQPQLNIIGQLQVVNPAKDEPCIVCLDLLEKEQCRQTHCKHIFHEKCLNEWLKKQLTCPLCRENLFEDDQQPQILKLRNLSSSTIVQGQFSLIHSERQPIQQVILSRSMNSRLAAFQ